jgi:hypothetical protein
MAKSPRPSLGDAPIAPRDAASAAADALARAADEVCRQHERLAKCLEHHCSDAELRNRAELTDIADRQLMGMVDGYETAAQAAPDARDAAWWSPANALWLAAREYARRHDGVDRVSRVSGKHSLDTLTALTVEFELERSALLQVKQAVAGYRTARPGAV